MLVLFLRLFLSFFNSLSDFSHPSSLGGYILLNSYWIVLYNVKCLRKKHDLKLGGSVLCLLYYVNINSPMLCINSGSCHVLVCLELKLWKYKLNWTKFLENIYYDYEVNAHRILLSFLSVFFRLYIFPAFYVLWCDGGIDLLWWADRTGSKLVIIWLKLNLHCHWLNKNIWCVVWV